MTETSERSVPVCVGTARAISLFHTETKMQLATGVVVRADDCVARQGINSLYFEHLTPSISAKCFDGCSSLAWDIVRYRSMWSRVDVLGVAMRDPRAARDWADRHGVSMVTGRFVRVHRRDFERNFDGRWASVLYALTPVLKDPEEGHFEFWPHESYFAQNVVDQDGHLEHGYDSIQHTMSIRVRSNTASVPPILRGRVAFRLSDAQSDFRIAWTVKSWRPVSGGFILDGE